MRFTSAVLGVTESPLVRIATLAESMPGSIKLCYGESDSPTPEPICRAADEAMRAGHTFYTNTAGYGELRQAIADKIQALHGVTYESAEVMCTTGATMAIYIALRALVAEGDNVVIVSPAYASFANCVRMCGGEVRAVPLTLEGDRFTLDLDRVRRAVDDRTRVIVVNSPSNPTGWMITADEQRDLYELAHRRNVVILSDEVYERLAYDTAIAPSFARIADDKDHIVVVNSFSKTWSMTGWRLGWIQANARMIRLMSSAAEFITSNPAAMVQQAGIVALRDGDPWVAELRDRYAARRTQILDALRGLPGLTVTVPQGAFYAFARADGLADSEALALDVLRHTGVALAPGSAFGEGGEGHLRFCFAAGEATLTEALGRFRSYWYDKHGTTNTLKLAELR